MKKRALLLAAFAFACAVSFASCGEKKETPCEHAWLAWEELLPAGCVSDGIEIRYCAADATHFEERAIPAKGHCVEEWFVKEDGHSGFCKDCGKETAIEAHSFKNGVCEFCKEEEGL